jgi:hypothetical protein
MRANLNAFSRVSPSKNLARTIRGVAFEYDVTRDGTQFMLDSSDDGAASAAPLTVVANWSSGLKQ